MKQQTSSLHRESFLHRQPVASYLALTFAVSWIGALLVAVPHLLRDEPLPKLTGILMFPAMLLGPSVVGIVLTRLVDGSTGLRDLFSRMHHFRFPIRWYAALLIPPLLVLTALLCLKSLVSPVYTPNRFLVGLAFGVPAGFFEEIGWMGFAFPKMRLKLPALGAAVLLGIFWGIWHLPVIDYLGTATPHGAYWLRLLVALFPFLHRCHDRHARPHRLALLQHEKRAPLSAHARLFDRLTGHLQPPSCVCRTGSFLVCRLCRRLVDRCRIPRARLWGESLESVQN
jgi:membrane protease YdiL (CAAX protease family)